MTHSSVDPDRVVEAGDRVSPRASKLLYGGYVVLAMAAVVLSWNRAPGALLGTAAVIVALSTVIALLTHALRRTNSRVSFACLLGVLMICAATAVLFLSSLFFGVPERGVILVARILDDRSLAILRSGHAPITVGADASSLPSAARVPPELDGNLAERVAGLSKLAPIIVDHAAITLDAPVYYFGILRLQDAILETGGRNVTIEAVQIQAVGDAVIRSHVPDAPDGQGGGPGGRLTLVVHDRVSGQLAIDLRGGAGGRGLPGRAGVPGADGGPGNNSSQGAFGCNHGGGQGGAGQRGGDGEKGGPGAPGGNGGTLLLRAPNPDRSGGSIAFRADGSAGGSGGAGGSAGRGGNGGPGGHGGGYCGGGNAGPNGPFGSPGATGDGGPSGSVGAFTKQAS